MIDQITDVELFDELRQRKALIVHCSRTGKGDEPPDGLFYPDDLIQAIKVCSDGKTICCSVIWPIHIETFGPIGIVVRPRSIKSITSISLEDAGSYIDSTSGERKVYVEDISMESVQETFTMANGYNEWNIENAETIGIFVHPHEHWEVSCKSKLYEVDGYEPWMGEEDVIASRIVTIPEIIEAFPGMKIYSFAKGELVEVNWIDTSLSYVLTKPEQLYPYLKVNSEVHSSPIQLHSTKDLIIDVWDVRTFDTELCQVLDDEVDMLLAYYEVENNTFLSCDLGRERSSIMRPENPYAAKLYELLDAICVKMEKRTIRAFHYTRMTEEEVVNIRRDGIHVSTPETLRQRLQCLVTSNRLSHDEAERLFAESPFQSDQVHLRSGKFWLTSHPVAIDDSGVAPLMERWGGEVASMHVRHSALSSPLLTIGEARIIEVAVPLCASKHSYCASNAIAASFARACGAKSSKSAFDLYVENALPPTSIIAVHTKGEITFENMGRIYPEGYVNIDMD